MNATLMLHLFIVWTFMFNIVLQYSFSLYWLPSTRNNVDNFASLCRKWMEIFVYVLWKFMNEYVY